MVDANDKLRWWTVSELARHYSLSPRTIYDAIAKAELTVHRFGERRAIRISDEDRKAWEQKSRSERQVLPERLAVTAERLTKPQLVAKHFRR
jgi:excisionase family DNA binding protein